jgi:hypothetical protein
MTCNWHVLQTFFCMHILKYYRDASIHMLDVLAARPEFENMLLMAVCQFFTEVDRALVALLDFKTSHRRTCKYWKMLQVLFLSAFCHLLSASRKSTISQLFSEKSHQFSQQYFDSYQINCPAHTTPIQGVLRIAPGVPCFMSSVHIKKETIIWQEIATPPGGYCCDCW